MADEWINADGTIVPSNALLLRRAKETVTALQSGCLTYARLVECRIASDPRQETIIIDVEPERPQQRVNDIRRVERIAVVFDEVDDTYPEVLSLRPDFRHVSHLNMRVQEFPRSLCLYERPWHEIKFTLTAPVFIDRILQWLTLTARGELHQPGQPLEPLIASSGYRLVVPPASFSDNEHGIQHFRVSLVDGGNGRTLVATTDTNDNRQGAQSLVFHTRCLPQRSGVIRRVPSNLFELHELLVPSGFNLITILRQSFTQLGDDAPLDHNGVFLLSLPKTRTEGGPVESTDKIAFMTTRTILEIGCDLGVWGLDNGTRGGFVSIDENKQGMDTSIVPVNVVSALTRENASLYSGFPPPDDTHVVAIGMGALGSQVTLNLARSGFGTWTLIDDDDLLPHNTVRHALGGHLIGHNKAELVALSANALFHNNNIATGYASNLLKPGDKAELVHKSVSDADVILDMSASIAVARYISHADCTSRRISVFLNPMGHDLVVMAESRDRSVRLNHLEMLYYRELVLNSDLAEHFPDVDSTVRYGQSCRDVSMVMPQDLVGVHAGIAARAIRTICNSDDAMLCVWRCDSDTFQVTPFSLPVDPLISQRQDEWTLCVHPQVLRLIKDTRSAHLPNETGGVLIGSFDTERRIAYVMHALLSPPDSVEWPTLYIRGCKHLAKEVNRVREATAMNLDYIGEWHSHPDGCDTLPSDDDLKVFAWLTNNMHIEGRPALMLIAGQTSSRLYIGRITEQYPEAICP